MTPIRRFALIAVLVLLTTISSPATAQTTRPIPQVDRVMIISIDGLRPDMVLRTKSPNLHRMFENGAFSFWAQTIPSANTLPSHTSMLTGVSMEKHGITFNDERATTRPIYPNAETIFELAKKAGYTTAMVTGKSKFMALNKPGSIDWLSAPEDAKTTDGTVADAAIGIIRERKPQVMFLHFPGADTAGHASGWASPQQFTAIELIDTALGRVLDELTTQNLSGSTVIIISADHGGSGRNHGANDLRSLHIPWIAYGPGVRKNFDLTSLRETTIRTQDTFATACFLLGIPLPQGIDGKPITPIVEGFQLLREAR